MSGTGTPALPATPSRRDLLRTGLAAGMATLLVRPASAQPAPDLVAVIAAFAAGTPVRVGKVTFDISPLVENGNAVPVTVRVESPMTAADHVREIAIFNERNPQRDVARFHLGPRAGRAEVSTRIRLATSQRLVALARLSDGSVWSHAVDVVVTLAACVE
jgi:sulfur-oxidizing protein SoxY